MTPLVDKYKPAQLADFAGIAPIRAMFERFASGPYASAWLLVGPAGTGKTTLAYAVARQIGGVKLPEVLAPMKAFWNGKGHSLELAHIKPTDTGVLPVVRCRHCGHMWRYQWSDVMEFIEPKMRERLERYVVPVEV